MGPSVIQIYQKTPTLPPIRQRQTDSRDDRHSDWHSDWHGDWHGDWRGDWRSDWHGDWHGDWRGDWHGSRWSDISDRYLPNRIITQTDTGYRIPDTGKD
jgi:hypothetical protein